MGMWNIGDHIQGRYEVRKILGGPGKSGMGIVYVCHDRKSGNFLAIKTVQDHLCSDPSFIYGFVDEAYLWTRMGWHNNIVWAQKVERINNKPYVFMEYIYGDERYGNALSDWIRKGALSLESTVEFAVQVCKGMTYADSVFQETGELFSHRDIKPQNILITRDSVVKITDFGLAKALHALNSDVPCRIVGSGRGKIVTLSKSGSVCGTPPYMSPEQCRGEKDIDQRSDIYAFGCVLHEMLTGKHVFESGTLEGYIHKHLNTTPQPPNVNTKLDNIVLKCLEKDKANRYQNFEELLHALQDVYSELTHATVRAVDAVPPSYETLLFCKGMSWANQLNYEEALKCIRECLQKDENNAVLHDALGYLYMGVLNQEDEAKSEFMKALSINANDAFAHYCLGQIHTWKDDYNDAINEFNIALSLNHYIPEARNNFGYILHLQDDLEGAIKQCKAAIRIEPKYGKARRNLGICHLWNGNFSEAIKELRYAARLDPFTDAHEYLAIAYVNTGEFNNAIQELKQEIRISPDSSSNHSDLGILYIHMNMVDEAIREFKEAIRLSPENSWEHYNLAAAYRLKGMRDDALKEFQEAIRLEPHLAENEYEPWFDFQFKRRFTERTKSSSLPFIPDPAVPTRVLF